MFKKKSILFYLLIVLNLQILSSLELSTTFNIGNMGFDIDRTTSVPALNWGINFIAKYNINEQFLFSGGVIVDELTGNRLETQLSYNSKYFQVGIGPSLASFNNSQLQLKPALNGYATFKVDGQLYLRSEIYSTIGNLSDPNTDYSQLYASLSFGLHIPSAICTFSVDSKQFTQFNIDSSSVLSKTSDIYSTYKLEADIHKKGIPFHLILTLGYKNIQRFFPLNDPLGRTMAGIGSAFIGIASNVEITKRISLNAGLDSGLYNFTLSNEIAPTDLPLYLFKTYLTFTYTF